MNFPMMLEKWLMLFWKPISVTFSIASDHCLYDRILVLSLLIKVAPQVDDPSQATSARVSKSASVHM